MVVSRTTIYKAWKRYNENAPKPKTYGIIARLMDLAELTQHRLGKRDKIRLTDLYDACEQALYLDPTDNPRHGR